MTPQAKKAKDWLHNEAFPLWSKRGIDVKDGGFYESLQLDGTSAGLPQRAMVQARQIFTFCMAEKYGDVPTSEAVAIVRDTTAYFVKTFMQPNGSIIHEVGRDRLVSNPSRELYTQAFGLFALANAYALLGDSKLKEEAKRLLAYLKRERRAKGGGYTEIKSGVTLYQSNPHMHLFEASLAWIQADPTDSEWRALADEIVDLFRSKFIDEKTGALCEHFSEGWSPQRTDGNFVFEPGHHFEWAWLVGVYQELTGVRGLEPIRHRLFDLGEKYGIEAKRRVALDEIWSDFRVKKTSARFWPQCERIKAAVQLGTEAAPSEVGRFARSADEAVDVLFEYIRVAPSGLWKDTWMESGEFTGDPVKSSSLYHIAGALYEYLRLRSRLPA